ncbi:MAG: hypothetical protein NZ700_11890 [Gemmataceae bacterium]|nr:hypothetical protein [Gemmataceae bacterium]
MNRLQGAAEVIGFEQVGQIASPAGMEEAEHQPVAKVGRSAAVEMLRAAMLRDVITGA